MNDRQFTKPFLAGDVDPAVWSRAGADAIERLRRYVPARARRARVIRAVLSLLAMAVTQMQMFSVLREPAGDTFSAAVGALMPAIMVGIAVWPVSKIFTSQFECDKLLFRLDPLGEHSELCHQALQMLDTPAVKAYRDQVLQASRELLVADWEVMSELHRKAQSADMQARTREACQRLHGVFDDDPAAQATG